MSTSNLIRLGGRSCPGRLMALLTATAVAASLLSAPSDPALASPNPAPATPPDLAAGLVPDGAEPMAVTLITGDTVLWQDTDDGSPRLEIEQTAREYPVTFGQSGTQEDYYVIPTDVMEHVVAGTLDRELFNIPGLIRQGLDDASTDELPVIVTFDHERSTRQLARDADAMPATSNPTAVEKVNSTGVSVNRDKAGAFRQAIFGKPGGGSSARAANAGELNRGVERILLDRVLKIDLSESVPQIGAPQAWDAGYTGEGITVAVLDTGIDTNHPDLTGQVVAEANFTDEPDATDTHGHGTHVASTIAGTGAASGGTRKGVAPGADLLNGKVCRPTPDGQGTCQTSWIMAGMEWATQQGADIVNMSLGGGATDGSDPLSQLLNQLSAETGTLFVTSAGNSGINNFILRVVGAPAAADAALAVGAVRKSDRMAPFSSRGPRLGDHAAKPEITAPGVGIVAARAEGTSLGSPVDDLYTSVNGTSMAAPHVAGAAALLGQATGLTGRELKDALVSTAADGGHRWYEQGTGRVDVPAALDSPVYAQGTLNFGGINGQAERDLAYTNRSQNDITLTLQAAATDLSGQPYDGITLSTDTLTVPAQGTATVTVTVALDASDLTGAESFGGVITATAPDGMVLRTGFGFGPPLHRVTIEVLDSNGNRTGTDTALGGLVSLTHDTLDRAAGGTEVYEFTAGGGMAVGHVPTGIYTIITDVLELEPGVPLAITRISLLVEVEIAISADIAITLDARDAVPIEQPKVPREAERRNHGVSLIRELVGAGGPTFTRDAFGGNWQMYVTPAPPAMLAPVSLFVRWTLAEPQPLHPLPWKTEEQCLSSPNDCYTQTPAYVYNLPVLYENGIPGDLHETVARRDFVEVPTLFHADHPDALVEHSFEYFLPFAGRISHFHRMWLRPGTVTEYFLADDRIAWLRRATIERRASGEPAQLMNIFSDDRFPAAEAGARRGEERWHVAPLRLGVWDVREESLHNPGPIERWASASRNWFDGDSWFVVPFHLMGNSRGHGGDADVLASWRMWNVDTGTELEPSSRLFFPLAPGEATYRLEQVEAYPASLPVLTGPATTVWTFTSRPSDEPVPQRYRCRIAQAPRQDVCQIQPLIRLEYDLGLDINNRARAGRAHLFTITAGHHSKAVDRVPVTHLRVRASFDGGDTWQDARVLGKPRDSFDTGGFLPSAEPYQQYRLLLRIPPLHRTTGFVSLRVQATDANGGTVDQTIPSAYLLN